MTKAAQTLSILILLSVFSCPDVVAHTDHDRARFVAQDGVDQGNCKNRFRPCASIAYAAQNANKGDTLLVAQGTYTISSVDDIFYLISDIVPALGGFQPLDNYQVQNPAKFATTLVGVPTEYADVLYQRGFNVIADTKSLSNHQLSALNSSLQTAQAMLTKQPQSDCIEGRAGAFDCSNISLLSHVPIADLPTDSNAANDIWGHVDLNTMKEYALLGMRRGVVLIDVSDPINPVIVDAITGQSTTWRDIKVYQYFSNSLNKWQAFAYATADSVSEGLSIIDLNDLGNGISLVSRQTDDPSAHNIYISNVDYSLNIANSPVRPRVHILGAQAAGGSLRSYLLNNPRALRNSFSLPGASRDDYTHDASSLLITDERATRDCQNSTDDGCLVMLDFNEGSMRLWDHTAQEESIELSETTYANAAYAHSGWWSEDKNYVLLHDELDEQRFGLNTTVHVFEISQLTAPVQIATWTGPTRAIDHNGFVRGNKYYMSNYERGVTILDISDPSDPQQIGFFDTFPSANGANFNGTWGVYPYLPSGIILASDIQGGLYVLKDETDSPIKANVSFNALSTTVQEGTTFSLEVTKTGIQSASVEYQVILGSSEASDTNSALNGQLSWNAADADSRFIEIDIVDDSLIESDEQVFVRLLNPSATSELGDISLTQIVIANQGQALANITFDQELLTVREIDGVIELQLNRFGDLSAAVQVGVNVTGGTAYEADFEIITDTIKWGAGDTAPKNINIEILNDDNNEEQETFTIELTPGVGVSPSQSSFTLTILDDDANQAPSVSLPSSQNVNARQSLSVSASASDPEGADLVYTWSQTAGDNVMLSNATGPTISFTAPNTAQTLTFSLTVTDNFEQTATASTNVIVAAATQVAAPDSSNGSSGGSMMWLNIGLILIALRRFGTSN